MSGSREKMRAVFLAFVMVTSIMVAGVAFSGNAAADAGGNTFEVQFDSDITDDSESNAINLGTGVTNDNTLVTLENPQDPTASYVIKADVDNTGDELVVGYNADNSNNIESDEIVAVVEDNGPNDLAPGTDGVVRAAVDFSTNVNGNSIDGISLSSINDGKTANLGVASETGNNINGEDDTLAGTSGENSLTLDFENVIEIDSGAKNQAGDSGDDAIENVLTDNAAGNELSGSDDVNSGNTIIVNSRGSSGPYTTVVSGIDENQLEVLGGETRPVLDADDAGSAAITVDKSQFNINDIKILGADDGSSVIVDSGEVGLTVDNSIINITSVGGQNNVIDFSDGGDTDDLTVRNSVISSDSTPDLPEDGLVVFGSGTVIVDNVTFTGLDEGIRIEGGSSHVITNSKFDVLDDTNVKLVADTNDFDSVDITQNTFDDIGSSGQEGVSFVENGKDFQGELKVTNNDFINSNGDDAIVAGDSGNEDGTGEIGRVINATVNFFGDSSGPSGIGPGSGASVDEEVLYTQVDSLGTSLTFLDSADGEQVDTLDVSLSPSSAVRGESVTVTGEIQSGGSTFNSRAQFALVGLSNDEIGSGATPSGIEGADIDPQVLAVGATTDGSFSISQTLNGAGQTASSNDRAIDEYYVVVRKGSTGFTKDTSDAGAAISNNINNVFIGEGTFDTTDPRSVFNIDGTAILRAGPAGTVQASGTERGTSVTIEGDLTVSDDSGLANYPVRIRNEEANSQLKSITTNDAGSYATSEVLDDAATHEVTVPLYNTSINNVDDSQLGTFTVDANDVSVSTDTNEISPVQESGEITLTTDGSADNDNVTRFRLSGADLEKLDVSVGTDSNNGVIEQLTTSDGTTFGGVDADEKASDVGDDNSFDTSLSAFDAASSTTATLASDASVTIESAVLVASNQGTSDNTVELSVDPAESGTLNVAGEVEDTDQVSDNDNADTPKSPDFTGSTSITVSEAGDLNVLLDDTSNTLAHAVGDPTNEQLTLTVLDADGNGLINSAGDGDIQAVTIDVVGQDTQFGIDSAVRANDDGFPGDIDGNFGSGDSDNLNTASVTIEDGDVGSDSTEFRVTDLDAEQNGTIQFNVTADVKNQDSDITASATYTVTQSDIVSGLPDGTFTVDESFDANITVTDGDGVVQNNRIVTIGDDSTDTDTFALDTNGDGSDEITGIDAIQLDGGTGQAKIAQGGDTGFGDDSTSISVNNGQYQLSNITVTNSGEDIDITIEDQSNNARARFPSQLSTTGSEVFNISSDADSFVAGFNEQVNLTISENGSQLTGSDLTDVLNNDAPGSEPDPEIGDSISQGGSQLVELSGTDATDTDDDNTVDTVQVAITPQSTNAINISADNSDATNVGSATVDVVEPDIQTNVTQNTLTERLQTDVNVQVLDPRDGTPLFDDDTTPTVKIKSFNGTTDISVSGGADTDVDDATTTNPDDDATFSATEGERNATVLPYRTQDSTAPFTVELSVDHDSGTFFGDTNVTVAPPQIEATPSSIPIGEQTAVEVTAEDANGNALADRRLDLIGAGVSITNANTDSSGFVAVNVNPQATGSIAVFSESDQDITAAGGGSTIDRLANDDTTAITQEDTVNVTTEQNEFDVSVSPQTVTANQTSTVTVTANNNATGDAREGASVTLSGAGVNESAQTDANGGASFDVTASQSGTIDVTVNDAGFAEATSTITVEAEPEPGAVQIDNVNLDPNSVTANTTNDHDLTFDALNVSADNSTDSFTVEIPSAATLESANDVTVTTENVSAQNLAVDGNNITFDVNPDSESVDVDLSVEANVTVSAPNVSQETTADLTINATDSDGSSDSASATLTITVEEAAPEPADFTVSNVTPDGVNVTAGDNITVSADIENVGGQQATQSVEFRIVAADGNTSIDNASATATQNVTLDAGANDTVTFENVSTDGLATGDFTHGVFSANDSATATITLQDQGLVARFDENDNGEIELTEVQTAIRAFSDGDLTLSEIQTLIRAFSGE